MIPPSVYEFYGSSGIEGYRFEQQVYIISQDVDTVESLALDVIPQLDTELNVYRSQLEYFYSNLDELKKDMVGEATQNARERALEMLKGSDMSLGKLRTLRQGGISNHPAPFYGGIKYGNPRYFNKDQADQRNCPCYLRN